ncbi:hypothetical protein M409DRAFT_61802 [Zasmidium cellare ATCC 36951]|uniref:Uncharacterized protein n=1 Tax=Zasmidium cellare ATCC 36951 TaxID=1080233 RepID=A0A6A6BXL8_ZASCE|nr:uncharacterized protein M409DRAFT_61802 [Zasmidium cellare ATCC 36951]KAF2158279.1 hypothetical protein M409DRAFT_61802 [Zasmidium cellare ATCC 36951]
MCGDPAEATEDLNEHEKELGDTAACHRSYVTMKKLDGHHTGRWGSRLRHTCVMEHAYNQKRHPLDEYIGKVCPDRRRLKRSLETPRGSSSAPVVRLVDFEMGVEMAKGQPIVKHQTVGECGRRSC